LSTGICLFGLGEKLPIAGLRKKLRPPAPVAFVVFLSLQEPLSGHGFPLRKL
jgi:hypothetical protein